MTAADLERMGLRSCVEVAVPGLFAVRLLLGEDGHKRIVPGEIAVALGADRNAANQRAKRAFAKGTCVMHAPSAGGPQEVLTLTLKYLPAFLLGFDRARVREDVRSRLGAIQDELYDALAAYTFEGVAVNPTAPSTALAAAPPAPVLADPVALTAAILAAVRETFAPMAEQIESLHRRLDVVQRKQTEAALTSGVLTMEQVELVKADVRDLAATWVALSWAPTLNAAGRRILHDLYQLAGMREAERHVHLVPAAAYGAILGRLARLRWEVRGYRQRLQLGAAPRH